MFDIKIADFKKTKKKSIKSVQKEEIKIPKEETIFITETEQKGKKNRSLKKAAI